jgi:outer membrane protein assembly factor BamB
MKFFFVFCIFLLCISPVCADKSKGLFSGDILQADLDSFTSNVSDAPGYITDQQSAVDTNPQDTQAWIDIGKSQLKIGNWKPAEETFSRVIALDPKSTDGWEGNLLAIRGGGNFDQLLVASEQATKEIPNYASVWKYYGIALSSLGRSEEALLAFDKALVVDPKYYTALYNKGIALDSLKRYNESVKAYEEVLVLNPKYTKAWNNKGVALNYIGRYDEAITAFDTALELDPEYKKARENKDIAVREKGKKSLGSVDIIDDGSVIIPSSSEDEDVVAQATILVTPTGTVVQPAVQPPEITVTLTEAPVATPTREPVATGTATPIVPAAQPSVKPLEITVPPTPTVAPLPSPTREPVTPDIRGDWDTYFDSSGRYNCVYTVTLDGENVQLDGADGTSVRGVFTDSKTIYVKEWDQSGKISSDGKRIDWDNTSYWILKEVSEGSKSSDIITKPAKISGEWYTYSVSPSRPDCVYLVTQNGEELQLDSSDCKSVRGYFKENNLIYSEEWDLNGKISFDGKRIDWDNKSYWILKEVSQPLTSPTREPVSTGTAAPLASQPSGMKGGVGMFRENPARTGAYPGPAALKGTLKWKFPTGGMSSSPTVVDGIIYASSYDKTLYAIDALSGEEKWKFSTEKGFVSSPSVSGGVLYVGNNDNRLYAIDAATGQKRWEFTTGDDIRSSPAVVNDVVYVGSYDNNLYAIDALTGQEKWRFTTAGHVFSSPAVVDGVVFVGSWHNSTYAIDAVTGKEKWRIVTGHDVTSSPAVSDGMVYIGCWDGYLYAIDAATGKEKWKFPATNGIHSSPTIGNGIVYVGSQDNNLYAIDAATGQETWKFITGGTVWSSPVCVDGVIYVGSKDQNLYAIDASSGSLKWKFATGGDVSSSPVVVNGVAYVGSADGYLYAIE